MKFFTLALATTMTVNAEVAPAPGQACEKQVDCEADGKKCATWTDSALGEQKTCQDCMQYRKIMDSAGEEAIFLCRGDLVDEEGSSSLLASAAALFTISSFLV